MDIRACEAKEKVRKKQNKVSKSEIYIYQKLHPRTSLSGKGKCRDRIRVTCRIIT